MADLRDDLVGRVVEGVVGLIARGLRADLGAPVTELRQDLRLAARGESREGRSEVGGELVPEQPLLGGRGCNNGCERRCG